MLLLNSTSWKPNHFSCPHQRAWAAGSFLHRLLASRPSVCPWFSSAAACWWTHTGSHTLTRTKLMAVALRCHSRYWCRLYKPYIILLLNHMWDRHIPAACKCYEHCPNNPGHGADLTLHVPLLLLSQTAIGDTDSLIKGSAGKEGWERLARIQSLGIGWLDSFCWSSFQPLCLSGRSFQSWPDEVNTPDICVASFPVT